jgi:pyruvate,water dikinase
LILSDAETTRLFKEKGINEIWEILSDGKHSPVKKQIDNYITRFGNRCVGELKLETISYEQDPSLFIKVIQSYVKQGITQRKGDSNIEENLRSIAEEKLNKILIRKPLKRFWFNYILKKARDLVSNRENLRYERTRGFGMVRKMFTALGQELYKKGNIKKPRDVFYMELDEVLALTTAEFDPKTAQKITERQKEFQLYDEQPDPEERFFTYGMNFTNAHIYSKEKMTPLEGNLKGTGCCPGKVQGKVRLVKHPDEVDTLNGDILVTSSTDPGWVTLFPTAAAIIVERGSLLSHSAIVAREMGIPCIVSVTGLLRALKTGDEIIMDGATGEIQIVE